MKSPYASIDSIDTTPKFKTRVGSVRTSSECSSSRAELTAQWPDHADEIARLTPRG